MDLIKSLSIQQAEDMVRPISNEEIESVFQGMEPNKSPGLDRINGFFVRDNWGLIKEDIFKEIKHVLRVKYFWGGLNTTHICPIPKTHNLKTIKEFRPISYCKVLYNAIAKIIEIMLKSSLAKLVSMN